MISKEEAFKEFKAYEKQRENFFAFLDENIPQKEASLAYDFEQCKTLDSQRVYELFFKLDYQARKVRGVAISLINEQEEGKD